MGVVAPGEKKNNNLQSALQPVWVLAYSTLGRTPLDEGSARRRDRYQLSVLLYQSVAMYQRHYDVIC